MPRVGLLAEDLACARIDGHDAAAKSPVEIVEDLGADLSPLPAGADNGHDGRLEEPLHGGVCGPGRAVGGVLLERRGWCDRKHDSFDAALHPALDRFKAAAAEHVDHPAVVPEDLGFKRRDAEGASDLGQPLEKARPDALALKSVLDGEGDLGAIRPTGQAEVMGDRDDTPGRLTDEGELPVVVDAAESSRPLRVDLRQREEPEVQAVGRQPLIEGQ